MLPHIRDAVLHRLELWFGDDAGEALSWMIASEDRRPVIVVGAGFSKNAVWKNRPHTSAASAIPLWSDIDRLLAGDLRLHADGAYDELMLPDVYATDIGLPRYTHTLLASLPDEEILPGPSHHALFELHRPEAVITTNQLDTLLDHSLLLRNAESRWFAVRTDTDLSQPEAERRVQLIYLHGHRSNPKSWVFGRSQYEDIDQTRPAMMRRVRQLFSQHPVLFIGFSLTDPNFHALIRQINREMNRFQPHALAIMIGQQPSSFVKHWRELGVRTVSFREKIDIDSAFGEVFRLLGSIGRDRRPSEGILTYEEVHDLVAAKNGLRARADALRDILAGRALPGGRILSVDDSSERKALRDLWESIALPSGAERDSVVRGPRYVSRKELSDSQWASFTEERRKEILDDDAFPYTGGLPSTRFTRSDRLARIVAWNIRSGAGYAEIATWLRVWFDAFIDVGNEPQPEIENDVGCFCDVLSWLVAITPRHEIPLHVAVDILTRCQLILERYEDRRLAHVVGDLAELGAATVAPADIMKLSTDLRASSDLALSGELQSAMEGYERVAISSQAQHKVWHRWLALDGAIRAFDAWVGFQTMGAPAPNPSFFARRANWGAERDRLEQHEVISRWISRLESRKSNLVRAAFEHARLENRDRLKISQTIVASSAIPNARASWRDLEMNGASPWRMSELVTLWLDTGVFEPETEALKMRLRYNVKNTDDWLDEIAQRSAPSDRSERVARDASLSSQLLIGLRGPVTEIVASLKAVPKSRWLLQRGQVDQLADFLGSDGRQFRRYVRTYDSMEHLSRDYARAWMLVGTLAMDARGYARFSEYMNSETRDIHENEAILDEVGRLPWNAWCTLSSPSEVLTTAFDWSETISKQGTRHSSTVLPCHALLAVLGRTRIQLSDQLYDRTMICCSEAAGAGGIWRDSVRSYAVQTAGVVSRTSDEFKSVALSAFPVLGGGPTDNVFATIDALHLGIMVALRRKDSDDLCELFASGLQTFLLQNASQIIDRLGKNRHLGAGSQIVEALSAFHRTRETALSPELAEVVARIVKTEPTSVGSIGPIFDRKFWSVGWEGISGAVTEVSRRCASDEATRERIAIIDLLYDALDHPELEAADWLVPSWVCVLGTRGWNHPTIARRGAELAGKILQRSSLSHDDFRLRIATDSLRAAAEDARSSVRFSAAATLRHGTSSGEHYVGIRSELLRSFQNETYASVRAVLEGVL